MYLYEPWAETHLVIYGRLGPEFRIQCPNPQHEDNDPSCDFNAEMGVFHCFSCGYSKRINAEDVSSLELEADVIKARLNKMISDDVPEITYASELTLARYRMPTSYWATRGLSIQTQQLFGLGYDAISNAATIPVRDMNGRLLGVTRRFLSDEHIGPRYKYPKGFKASQNLFASWLYDQYDMSTISMHEGSIDAMRLWQLGIPATALYGSNISAYHVHILMQMGVKKIVYFGDSDGPGQRAKERAKGYWARPDDTYTYKKDTDLSKHFLLFHVTQYNNKKDAGEISDTEILTSWKSAEPYTFHGNTKKKSIYIPIKQRIKNAKV